MTSDTTLYDLESSQHFFFVFWQKIGDYTQNLDFGNFSGIFVFWMFQDFTTLNYILE